MLIISKILSLILPLGDHHLGFVGAESDLCKDQSIRIRVAIDLENLSREDLVALPDESCSFDPEPYHQQYL